MGDPNLRATGPTKWRAEHCVTHYHACDCREWEHACQVERLEEELARLRAEVAENKREIDELVRAANLGSERAKKAERDRDELRRRIEEAARADAGATFKALGLPVGEQWNDKTLALVLLDAEEGK